MSVSFSLGAETAVVVLCARNPLVFVVRLPCAVDVPADFASVDGAGIEVLGAATMEDDAGDGANNIRESSLTGHRCFAGEGGPVPCFAGDDSGK